jgi:hypothetical protein
VSATAWHVQRKLRLFELANQLSFDGEVIVETPVTKSDEGSGFETSNHAKNGPTEGPYLKLMHFRSTVTTTSILASKESFIPVIQLQEVLGRLCFLFS